MSGDQKGNLCKIVMIQFLLLGRLPAADQPWQRRLWMVKLAPVLSAVLLGSAWTRPAVAEARPPSAVPERPQPADAALTRTIIGLYEADQALLADLAKARADEGFNRTLLALRARLATSPSLRNFGEPALYALWAKQSDAPAIVLRAVAFRKATDAQLRDIVARHGWPRRAGVGDRAAAGFFFLFGHADDDNSWRLTQRATLERVAREDAVTPRLYAHLVDRLADVAGEPQVYGSIMGSDKTPGSAKLYAPLVDDVKAADARRAAIGLPTVEADLAKFRAGADIGPYMTPMIKGTRWTIADVYSPSDPVPAGAAPDLP